MAQDKVDIWPMDSVSFGVDVWTPNLAMVPSLKLAETYNVSTGLADGFGPRYGMAPLPGHSDAETLTGQALPGLMKAEQTSGTGMTYRTKVFGVVPMRLRSYDLATTGNFYAWIVARKPASQLYLSIVLGSRVPSSVYLQQEGIASGLPPDLISIGSVSSWPLYELMPEAASATTEIQTTLAIDDTNHIPFATLSVSGVDAPMRYCFGGVVAIPTATKGPEPNFVSVSAAAIGALVLCGVPPEYNLQTFKTGKRQVKFHCFTSTGAFFLTYAHDITPTTSIFKQALRLDTTPKNIDLTGLTGTKIGSSTSYSNTKATLVEDANCVCNSSYKAIAVATPDPKIAILQDWMTGQSGEMVAWADPTAPRAVARDLVTVNYTTIGEATCWAAFPKIDITPGTTYNGIGVGHNGNGILRAGTTYEVAYSLYNKRTNHETNVGTPAKLAVPADASPNFYDFAPLQLWSTEAFSSNTPYSAKNDTTPTTCFPWIFGTNGLDINYYEYRIYYRVAGSFEWLPGGSVDAAYYWFYPGDNGGRLWTCTGATATLPGGQPGGFVDYSPLPKEKYIDVVAWKERLWWCSEKAVYASLQRNVFAYPGRLSFSASSSDFRGITVHAFPGQADQRGRLVIWGAKENYIAYFTGQKVTQFVQVSADSGGDFPVDGSDLQIDPWTTMTAFSSRSAIVADGELYWWGPQGIFHDNGTNFPDRLSGGLEPDLATLYDPSQCRQIHCTYNDATREIVWFYAPKTADAANPTHGLVYNLRTGAFHPLRFGATIDASQRLNVESTEKVAGNRTMVVARTAAADPQRAYFFDERCRSGDIRPKTELMVKTIATPTTGQRRLTLAAGYDATNFATIAVGDYIAIHQGLTYATSMTACDSMIAKVTAVSTGSGYIDVLLPNGASMDASASLTRDTLLPIWHLGGSSQGLNAIDWCWATRYWAPGGLRYFAHWLYTSSLARITAWPSVDQPTVSLSYGTPTSGGETTDELELVDNSKGNWQCLHPLSPGEGANTEGQAISLKFSGYHIGPEWVLQYLEAHSNLDDSDGMTQFQG